eukprot:gene15981-22113_t
MFWKVAGFAQASPVEKILDKCTPEADWKLILDELLETEDVLQEFKSMNARLVSFLKEKSNLELLIRYMFEVPEVDDPENSHKLSLTSCELLSCDGEGICAPLASDYELLNMLFSFLDTPPPLACRLAGYCGLVISNLHTRHNAELVQFLQEQPTRVDQLVSHSDSAPISDVLKRLVGAEGLATEALDPKNVQWLSDISLDEKLVSQLKDNSNLEAKVNAAGVLSAIARMRPSPLAAKMLDRGTVTSLLGQCTDAGDPLLMPTLGVCTALLQPRNAEVGYGVETEFEQTPADADSGDALTRAAALAVLEHLPGLVAILRSSNHTKARVETACGFMPSRLGLPRLKIVEFMAVLVRCGFQPATSKSADESFAPKAPIRAGYMGHITHICSILETLMFQGNSETPQETLGMPVIHTVESANAAKIYNLTTSHQGWNINLAQVVQPQLELENTTKWMCGRPTSEDMHQDDSDDFHGDMTLEQMHRAMGLQYST